jgi:hypothetical protein
MHTLKSIVIKDPDTLCNIVNMAYPELKPISIIKEDIGYRVFYASKNTLNKGFRPNNKDTIEQYYSLLDEKGNVAKYLN